MFNAHLHLDRSLTIGTADHPSSTSGYDPTVHISLHEKHSRIADIHAGPAYEPENLTKRVNACLDMMVACGTRRADTMVDVSADRVGLSALRTLQAIKADRASEIELNLAAYTPFGFTDLEPDRWDLMQQGAAQSDFLGFLPEADDHVDHPDHIGFEEHCRRALLMSRDLGKFIHVHADQRNEPSEDGMIRLMAALDEAGSLPDVDGAPAVWGVHVISPTTYDEDRFQSLVADMVRHNVGVICCPTAAIGMRQLRPIMTPTDNSFPRVLDYLAAGVQVRIASDNIADACSPSTTADLADEVLVLSAACRFYDPQILAKIACGVPLNEHDRDILKEHLETNSREVQKVIASL